MHLLSRPRFFVLLAALFLGAWVSAQADDEAAKSAAVAAMMPWLAEIDAGDYQKSWSEAATTFRKGVSTDKWKTALTQVRVPLGKVLDRQLVIAVYQTSVPRPQGDPLKGKFVIAQFKTGFQNMSAGIETVTFEQEADGIWRASGYFIRPAM